ncbi:MAG TPA: LuxR family transcriptional regulator [Allosphingosinicella sp.]|nr:LuxR family transcriptional regulator [Allosphingosinicella sp.]
MSIAGNLRAAQRHDGLSVVQDFVTTAAKTTSMADLASHIESAIHQLGFDYFAIVHHVLFGRPEDEHVRLTNYPLEWVGFVRELPKLTDPVVRAAERAASGFKWDQLDSLLNVTPAEAEYMREAARRGICHGYTVPNHVPGETFGSCSFSIQGGKPFPEASVSAAQALGSFAFEAARKLLRQRPGQIYLQPAPLSDRQRECLLFVARGKSDSVIADLLAIRPKTVNEHIEAAKRRYSVATRSQLLVRALFRSEICFSEVID